VRSAACLSVLAAAAVLVVVADRPSAGAPTQNPFPSPLPSIVASPQSNPFPSPSPTPRSAFGNGYVTAGYLWGSSGGGTIEPLVGTTATPRPFPGSANESGFWINMAGRVGPSYLATLSYENYGIFGGDRPYVSYAQLAGLYEPPASRLAFGLGFASVQRSTVNANMDSFGPGITLFPNFSTRVSPYASVFFYPNLHTSGSSSSLFAGLAGLVYSPRPGGGLFVRLGVSAHCCLPAVTSPKSDFGTTIGLGTAF
jgi:hypothetical protein